MGIYMQIYIYIYMCVCVCVFVLLYLSICLPTYQSINLSTSSSIYLCFFSIYPSTYLSVYLPNLSIYLSTLFIYLSIYLMAHGSADPLSTGLLQPNIGNIDLFHDLNPIQYVILNHLQWFNHHFLTNLPREIRSSPGRFMGSLGNPGINSNHLGVVYTTHDNGDDLGIVWPKPAVTMTRQPMSTWDIAK